MSVLTIRGARIEAVQGDITREKVDAIVNAANTTLLGGGGVDGAIHRAGGPGILDECRRLNGCETGDAKATTAGNLNAQWVIHTPGPIYRDGGSGEPALLASSYRRSIEVAAELGAQTIAFPAISCGVFGYPLEEAAAIAVATVADHVHVGDPIVAVRFVLFSGDIHAVFARAIEAYSNTENA